MNQSIDSFKIFALWLAALFLTALGAQLWIAWLYGAPIPLWDQWYEASFFKSWVTGHLTWAEFFAGHNEHRILATRVLDLSLIQLNGRWEPLLQMTVNAFIHAGLACGLAFCLWRFFGRINGWLVCCLLMFFFGLPYWGENAIWGINSLYYFMDLFGVAALAGLGFCKAGGWRWWIGFVAAIAGLFTTASGLLAPVAAGGVIILRMLKNRRMDRMNIISLAASLVIVAMGAAVTVFKEADQSFQAHSFLEFTAALTRNLSWPFYHASFMPCFIGLPVVLLLAFYLRPNFPQARAAEFLLVLALWSALQSVAVAYGRANYGGDIPSSRYSDFFNIFVIAGVFAAVLLASLADRRRFLGGVLAFIYIGAIVCGLCRMSQIVVHYLLVPTRKLNLMAEEQVQRFVATGNQAEFLKPPTVPPDPKLALEVLGDPQLQPILPLSCIPQSPDIKPERLMSCSNWLMGHAIAILSAGLLLFCVLCGFGLARGTPGLAPRNPATILALLAGLAALGFVWSSHSVSRNSVTYALQRQIAADFTAAGNASRAAFHEQKADALKQFAN